MNKKWVRRTIHWLLFAVVLFYILTGFGITEYRTVETITFGLLTKAGALKIHDVLWIPLAVLLAAHLCYTLVPRLRRRN